MYLKVPQDSCPWETWGAQVVEMNHMVFLGPLQLGCGFGPRSHSLISWGFDLWEVLLIVLFLVIQSQKQYVL